MPRWRSGQSHLSVKEAPQGYGGSNPSRGTKIKAWVAQLAEHVFGKDEVSGSIPDSGS